MRNGLSGIVGRGFIRPVNEPWRSQNIIPWDKTPETGIAGVIPVVPQGKDHVFRHTGGNIDGPVSVFHQVMGPWILQGLSIDINRLIGDSHDISGHSNGPLDEHDPGVFGIFENDDIPAFDIRRGKECIQKTQPRIAKGKLVHDEMIPYKKGRNHRLGWDLIGLKDEYLHKGCKDDGHKNGLIIFPEQGVLPLFLFFLWHRRIVTQPSRPEIPILRSCRHPVLQSYSMTKPPDIPIPTEPVFSDISLKYDRLNQILSLGLHRRWRQKLVKDIHPGDRVLDIACGTGDVALAVEERGARVIGLDPSLRMLQLARTKGLTHLVCAQGEALPFHDGVFDGATVAFGIRNFADPKACMEETERVLSTPGTFGILEFSLPRNLFWRTAFNLYRKLIPLIGAVLAGSWAAYGHLATSIGIFASFDLVSHARRAGFTKGSISTILGGIVTLTLVSKGEPDGRDS
mgnify:CR=1 FL=1